MPENIQKISLYKTSDGTVFLDEEDAKEYSHFEKFYFDCQQLFESDSGSFPLILCDQNIVHEYIKDGTFHRFFKKFVDIYKQYYPNPELASEDVVHRDHDA